MQLLTTFNFLVMSARRALYQEVFTYFGSTNSDTQPKTRREYPDQRSKVDFTVFDHKRSYEEMF